MLYALSVDQFIRLRPSQGLEGPGLKSPRRRTAAPSKTVGVIQKHETNQLSIVVTGSHAGHTGHHVLCTRFSLAWIPRQRGPMPGALARHATGTRRQVHQDVDLHDTVHTIS